MTHFKVQFDPDEQVWFGSRDDQNVFHIPGIVQEFFIEGPDADFEDVRRGARNLAELENFRTRRRVRFTVYSKNGTVQRSKVFPRPSGGCRLP